MLAAPTPTPPMARPASIMAQDPPAPVCSAEPKLKNRAVRKSMGRRPKTSLAGPAASEPTMQPAWRSETTFAENADFSDLLAWDRPKSLDEFCYHLFRCVHTHATERTAHVHVRACPCMRVRIFAYVWMVVDHYLLLKRFQLYRSADEAQIVAEHHRTHAADESEQIDSVSVHFFRSRDTEVHVCCASSHDEV